MKKDRLNESTNGFTLIEVMISIAIVSLILLISTNILESSISSRSQTLNALEDIKKFNILSNTIRRDLRQSMNVPMRDIYGLPLNATFYYVDDSERLIFTTMINHSDSSTGKLRRVEYLLQDKSFIRRQYFAANPYLGEEYFDSVMMENVNDIFFKFSDGYQWFPEWPKDQNTSRVMPQLIEIKLLLDDQEIEWLISPRINHVYEY